MTFLPVLTPWIFWPLVVILLAGAVVLVLKKGGRSRGTNGARWRFAALVVLIVVAAARPGIAGGHAEVSATELNVFFVVDTTPSSAAEDYAGTKTRITGMKSDINAIAEELAGARFSLISFDSKARVVMPLTTDTTALRTLTQVLTPRSTYASQGSSISSAKGVLAKSLKDSAESHPERPRLVFYLGDGEQTSAKAPESFASDTDLVDGGAVLGYGTAAGAKMRESTYDGTQEGPYIIDPSSSDYGAAISVIDQKLLQAIATQLDVPYVHRVSPADIQAALVDSSPKAAQSTSVNGEDRGGAGRIEWYWLPALAAFGIVMWELLLYGRAYSDLRRKRKVIS